MAINKILSQLSQVETIIKGWQNAPMSTIEREIVLEKLRSIYDEVIFVDNETLFSASAQDESTQEFSEKEDLLPEIEIPELDDEPEDEFDNVEITFTVPVFDEQEDEEDEQDEQDDSEEELVYFDDEDAQFDEEEDEDVENLAAIDNSSRAVSSDQELDQEIKSMLSQSKIDNGAINSLYGEPTQSQAPTQTQSSQPQQQPQPQEQATQASLDIDVPEVASTPVAKPQAAKPAPTKPAAKSIRSSIGMNDKYIMTRNMFDSDSRMFEKTIGELDEMTDINEAMLYINDNFSWNPEDNSVKLLISLLEDKLL